MICEPRKLAATGSGGIVSENVLNLGLSALPGSAEERVTHEDVLRARDRQKILKTRTAKRSLRLLWLLAGPGVLVMLGENDGPSMVSYATTGATYGIGFFVPFILLTFLMAFVVQEMTVRLGVATHRGHAELIFQRFGPFWGYFAMGDLVFGNLLTLVTEFIAIQAGGLYVGLPSWLSVAIGVALVIGSLAFRRYVTWERALMGLAAFRSERNPGRRPLFWAAVLALSRHRCGARHRFAGLSAIRDLGTRADGIGGVQPAVHSSGLARASERRRSGPCPCHLGANAGRHGHCIPHTGPRRYRRDGDPLDDLLSAERGRR